MHFKNFTLRELCSDRPSSLELGGNMASRRAVLTFPAEEEVILDALDLSVICDSVYGGICNSPCLTSFAWIELRVERLFMQRWWLLPRGSRANWGFRSEAYVSGRIQSRRQWPKEAHWAMLHFFTQTWDEWRYSKKITRNKNCVNLFILILHILFICNQQA